MGAGPAYRAAASCGESPRRGTLSEWTRSGRGDSIAGRKDSAARLGRRCRAGERDRSALRRASLPDPALRVPRDRPADRATRRAPRRRGGCAGGAGRRDPRVRRYLDYHLRQHAAGRGGWTRLWNLLVRRERDHRGHARRPPLAGDLRRTRRYDGPRGVRARGRWVELARPLARGARRGARARRPGRGTLAWPAGRPGRGAHLARDPRGALGGVPGRARVLLRCHVARVLRARARGRGRVEVGSRSATVTSTTARTSRASVESSKAWSTRSCSTSPRTGLPTAWRSAARRSTARPSARPCARRGR